MSRSTKIPPKNKKKKIGIVKVKSIMLNNPALFSKNSAIAPKIIGTIA